jgi:hypothetical protein
VAGALPLFEVSYMGVTGAIMLITTIGYLNSTGFLAALQYAISPPNRVLWLLLSSFLPFLGSAMHRLLCPQRVQEFSGTHWVEQHGRPLTARSACERAASGDPDHRISRLRIQRDARSRH